jgi:hypothetical protein
VIAAPATDPVFAAIDAHLAAVKMLDENLTSSEFASLEAYAADYLVDTVPTTMAGLRALEAHLGKDRSILCRVIIRNRWLVETQPDGRMSAEYSEYVKAAPEGDHREQRRRYYERPLQAFIADRRAGIDQAA